MTVNELMLGTAIMLGERFWGDCGSLDVDGDLAVDVSELTLGVAYALRGCGPTDETAALLGAYDVTGEFLYGGGTRSRQGVGLIERRDGRAAQVELDFSTFTAASFSLTPTSQATVRLDGYDVEEGDLVQFMAGSAHVSSEPELITVRGTVASVFGAPFASLSLGINLEMTRNPRYDPTPFSGTYHFTFGSAEDEAASISIDFRSSAGGTCGAADIIDSSGTLIRHLDEASCDLSSSGRFLYDGRLLTMRGALQMDDGDVTGNGTFAVGFGIGTSIVGEWRATRGGSGSEVVLEQSPP